MDPQHWNEPIRVEVGRSFSDSGFFSKPKSDLLIPETQRLRDALKAKGIFLPPIRYGDNAQIQAQSFRLICGVNDCVYNCNDVDGVMEILASVAQHYYIAESPSVGMVKKLVKKGNDLLSEGEYNHAMDAYDKAYYWALIVDGDLTRDFINAVFNMGYIFFINNRLSDAYDCGLILQSIVDTDNFHDPITRYHTHMFQANLLCLDGQQEKALALFQQCAHDVANVGQPELMMLALWNVVCSCLAIGARDWDDFDFDSCIEALNSMDDLIIKNPNIFSDNQEKTVLRIIKSVQSTKISQLQAENASLCLRCQDLEKRLSVVNLFGCAVRSVSGLLLTISAVLPHQMSFNKAIGELVVSGNTFQHEASVIDKLYAF